VTELDPDSAKARHLLDEVRSGGETAFERLFALHRPGLRRFVALRLDQRLQARLDASDIVQETQLEAFWRMDDFLKRRPMPFRVWLRKTAYEWLLKRAPLSAAA
jgi:RNA polymerase sigma-70 factor, ECF subfamily